MHTNHSTNTQYVQRVSRHIFYMLYKDIYFTIEWLNGLFPIRLRTVACVLVIACLHPVHGCTIRFVCFDEIRPSGPGTI